MIVWLAWFKALPAGAGLTCAGSREMNYLRSAISVHCITVRFYFLPHASKLLFLVLSVTFCLLFLFFFESNKYLGNRWTNSRQIHRRDVFGPSLGMAWCNLQVKLCDPCLSALYVCVLDMALYKTLYILSHCLLSCVTDCFTVCLSLRFVSVLTINDYYYIISLNVKVIGQRSRSARTNFLPTENVL